MVATGGREAMTRPVERSVRNRQCKCGAWFETPHGGGWPAAVCSPECHRDTKRAEAPAPGPRRQIVTKTASKPKRSTFTPASPAQREAIRSRPCLVDASHDGPIHPMHLIPRGMLAEGQEDPRAVVPGCAVCHRAYDSGELSLLEHLEPRFRVELAYAVERFGLVSTLRRVTNERQDPCS